MRIIPVKPQITPLYATRAAVGERERKSEFTVALREHARFIIHLPAVLLSITVISLLFRALPQSNRLCKQRERERERLRIYSN